MKNQDEYKICRYLVNLLLCTSNKTYNNFQRFYATNQETQCLALSQSLRINSVPWKQETTSFPKGPVHPDFLL